MQPSRLTQQFEESIIREMTRHAMEAGAVNLSQGYPDFDPPEEVVEAAVAAIRGGENQYTVTWGFPPLRRRLAEVYGPKFNLDLDPDVHVTVTCGVTEGIVVALMGVLNPGDEVIVLEPAHENFRPAAMMAGARVVPVPMLGPDYRLDADRLAAAVTPRTRVLLLNTPHNPTGRVFDEGEMQALEELIVRHDLVLITDEIYEHIVYDGRVHKPPVLRPGLRDRTVTVGGMSKTFAITGWRLGFVFAPTALAAGVRRAHDYMTICAPTPLQAAGVAALNLPAAYLNELGHAYQKRRDTLLGYLAETGFEARTPEGAYYTIADYRSLPLPQAKLDSRRFAMWLTRTVGVAVVPMNSFYTDQSLGEGAVRFAFPKRVSTLHEAGARLLQMRNL